MKLLKCFENTDWSPVDGSVLSVRDAVERLERNRFYCTDMIRHRIISKVTGKPITESWVSAINGELVGSVAFVEDKTVVDIWDAQANVLRSSLMNTMPINMEELGG